MRHNLPDLQATTALAEKLAAQLRIGDVLLLQGDLGAGKTTLARALIQSLAPDVEEVPSPTFTLVQQYDTPRGPLYHYDLYRLKHPDEIFELGFEDSVAEGIVLVEWPERLAHYASKYAKKVHLTLGEGGLRWAEVEGF
ncbi:MAG: tRNA (adenosine(37)-N6)-threonylcarbamoyltransferase complex ATPase subunit type 1 TsaE [Bdellovibrionales bacterium]